MLNNIVIQGRLTAEPILRYTQSQKPVVSFTLAVERDYAGEGGARPADFIDCVAWQGTAEFVNRYFGKGMMAAVKGRLQLRDWTDKDGNKRRNAEVLVESIYFTGDRKKDSGDTRGEYQTPDYAAGEFEPAGGDLPWEMD